MADRARLKVLFALVFLTAAVVVYRFVFPSVHTIEAIVGAPVSIVLKDAGVNAASVAEAVVTLTDGVEFYSPKFPNLQKQKQVRLKWQPEVQNWTLPLSVVAANPGEYALNVQIFGADQKQLKSIQVVLHAR